jgi:hypothetical protein
VDIYELGLVYDRGDFVDRRSSFRADVTTRSAPSGNSSGDVVSKGAAPEHLFISYATEDAAAADWLTLKLTAAGYRVWCDRFKLLGGEPWPEDIDLAIKKDTFRLIHLLSRHSLHKPNPRKERELALAIGRERQIPDFLIPLNLDRLPPSELPWRLSDVNYIAFDRWATGFGQLLRKLESIPAPRPLADGGALAASAYLPRESTKPEPEHLFSNCLLVERIPIVIRRYRSSRPLRIDDLAALEAVWPFRQSDERLALAFGEPPRTPPDLRFSPAGGSLWDAVDRIDGVFSRDLVSELLRKAVTIRFLERGMHWAPRKDMLFLPRGVPAAERITFVGYTRKPTYVQSGGERTLRSGTYGYRLGVSVRVRRDLADGFAVILRPRLHITDEHGNALDSDAAFVRRKHTARSWFNHEWALRVLALRALLQGNSDAIELSCGSGGEAVVLSTHLLGASVQPRINEEALLALGHAEADPPPVADDDLEELDTPEEGS